MCTDMSWNIGRKDIFFCLIFLEKNFIYEITIAGLGMTHVKIRVEFALFEWMTWYQDNMPGISVQLNNKLIEMKNQIFCRVVHKRRIVC